MSRQGRFAHFRAFYLLLITFALVMAKGLFAQVDTGQVLGTVKDKSGAVVPGAKVTLTNEGTSFTISTTTGPDGTYIFTPVKIATYTVQAEYTGFQKATQKHITVNVQQSLVVDFTLVPGQVVQTVEVTAEVPLLQTTNAAVGQVVNSKAVNDLPLNGRNFTFLAQLTAGVNVGQQETRGLDASGDFSANGNRPSQNNYLLDGIDNNIDVVDFLNGTAFVVLPSVDAIQEFKVETNNYSAEIGRAGGAVLNASIKSGTNDFHGDAWWFVRNDKFDAADFFENSGGSRKGKFRQNQFGVAAGGPVIIPHLYNGKNKTFVFGDYEGTRVRQGTPWNVNVPTVFERNSSFTDFRDLITGQSGAPNKDILGRSFPPGTIFDPATTRSVTANVVDPVTGRTPTASGFVRDPFFNGSLVGVTNFSCPTIAGCLLNVIPAGRLDPNAIKLLNLYPLPTSSAVLPTDYQVSPVRRENVDRFDIRVDHNFSERDQIFVRISYFDDPQFKPGPFTGIADGGGFNQGDQVAKSQNGALSWTHSVSPSLVNEARYGFSYIHTGRLQPNGNTTGIPAQFGIQGIPQVSSNGGLPAFGVGGLNTLGSNAFLVSDEFNSTQQLTENLTKIYHSHTFKGGFEFQHIKFSTLQPPWSRGQFNFDGPFTSIIGRNDSTTGRAQLLLTPTASTVAGGINFVGGANSVFASNIANTDNGHNYDGLYFKDDWKVTPKLTLNLGVRWDYFGYVEENFGAQANFLPGAPGSGAQYLIPIERKNDPRSTSFDSTLAKDGIALVFSNNFALGNSQKSNFSPRIGFAYQATPKVVVRGGYGIFYGGFENRGYSPNIGENYPFQFSFAFFNPDAAHPITYTNPNGTTCLSPTATTAVVPAATVESGFSCIPLQPNLVNASGLQLRGIQFNYVTPYTQGYNLILQYQLRPDTSVEAGYVGSMARHLEVFPGSNESATILPPNASFKAFLPFKDFAPASSYAATEGNSYYHSLQVKVERRYSNGLNFLGAYTWSKVRSDARDLLNNFVGGYRAPYVPGFGIQHDYGLADFDIRHAFHLSGGYELPLGHGKRFMKDTSGAINHLVAGWTLNYILTLQGGQPFTVPCNITTTAPGNGANFNGTSGTCYALFVPGQNPYAGKHNADQWLNPSAFHNPAPAVAGSTDFAPLGGAPNQLIGPPFKRVDFSIFKQVKTSEKTHLEFRAEFFNLTNHPNFSLPGFSGNGFTAAAGSLDFNSNNFGKITGTRDTPNDPRQIQFALKLYF